MLVLCAVTERPEGAAAGAVRLVGTDENAILEAVVDLLDDETVYSRMAQSINPYGDVERARELSRQFVMSRISTKLGDQIAKVSYKSIQGKNTGTHYGTPQLKPG